MEQRKINSSDAQALCDFYSNNRTHLAPWEPERGEFFYASNKKVMQSVI